LSQLTTKFSLECHFATLYHEKWEGPSLASERDEKAGQVLRVFIEGSLHLGELGHLNDEEKGTELVNEYGKSYKNMQQIWWKQILLFRKEEIS
jgi:hypothetical protein